MIGDRFTTTVPLALIALLAALTYWLDQVAQPPPPRADPAMRNDPDYIVEGLSAMTFNQAGSAEYTLSAEKMVHYPAADETVLLRPLFVSYGSAKAPVTITANEARVSSDGENVYFRDDVRVTRAPYGRNSELLVQTDFMHVIPDANVAKTHRPVTVTEAATTVTAVGLEINSETHVIRLLSNVQGTYDPRKAPHRPAEP